MINSLGINKRPKDTKVIVAMSGDVDSSVVAGIMKNEGYDVSGITLKLYNDTKKSKEGRQCCAGQDILDAKRVSEHLNINGWNASLSCGNSSTGSGNTTTENIYQTQNNDAPRNKEAKWNMIFNENRFLKCKSNNETKKLETFKVCRWGSCTYKNDLVFDDPIYISRVEMLLNNGKKRKYLYFQSDYNIKTTTSDSSD